MSMGYVVSSDAGLFGAFKVVQTFSDYLSVDGATLPLSVIGAYTVANVEIPPFFDPADYSLVNGALVANAVTPSAPVAPESVPMLNAHLALIAAGKMDAVNAAIASMDTASQQAANAYLNLAQTCRRDNALVAQLGPLIGLDSTGLDQLFIAAAALNP